MGAAPVILTLLHDRAERTADRPAIWGQRGHYFLPTSWRDLQKRTTRIALGLQQHGIGPGDQVALVSDAREEWPLVLLAALSVGAVVLPLDRQREGAQLKRLITEAKPKLLIVEDEAAAKAIGLSAETFGPGSLVLIDGAEGAPLTLGHLEARGQSRSEAEHWDRVNSIAPGDLALCVATAGTTGDPRLVWLTHENISWTAHALVRSARLTDSDIGIALGSPSLVAEQMTSIYAPLACGMQVYWPSPREQLDRKLSAVRPTVVHAVPRVWRDVSGRMLRAARQRTPSNRLLAWAQESAVDHHRRSMARERIPTAVEVRHRAARATVFHPLHQSLGLERLRLALSSGGRLSRDVLERLASVDVAVREAYVVTEASGFVAANEPDEGRLGSAGRALPGVKLRIADSGELWIHSPGVSEQLDARPSVDKPQLSDGWLRTGDWAELDSDGFLRIVSRAPSRSLWPMEERLREIPPVQDAAVISAAGHRTSVVTIDAERAIELAHAQRWLPESDLATGSRLRQYLREQISARINRQAGADDAITRLVVLFEPWTAAGGELTPALEPRREAIARIHADAIGQAVSVAP